MATDDQKLEGDVIVSALNFWKKVYEEKEVIIKFTKKDDTIRTMRCTLDFTKIPVQDHPKKVDIPQILKLLQKSKIMHVYDLDKKGWRSVPFEKVEYMDTKGGRYYVKKKGK